jgi:hypothetical protein
MKKGILNFKAAIRFFVSIVTSREWAFIYCLTGTIAQISHTYFLVESISSLEGTWRAVQATLISFFISSSLLYFVAIADDEDSDAARKIHRTVTLFTVIECTINVYYYTRHILINPLVLNKDPHLTGYFDLGFALMMSVMIPITIKLYASSIRAQDWLDDIEHGRDAITSTDLLENQDYFLGSPVKHTPFKMDEVGDSGPDLYDLPKPGDRTEYNGVSSTVLGTENQNITIAISEEEIEKVMKPLVDAFNEELLSIKSRDVEIDNEQIAELAEKFFVEKFTEKVGELDTAMGKAFERNSAMFLKQFENKVKQITTKGFSEIRTPQTENNANNKDNE